METRNKAILITVAVIMAMSTVFAVLTISEYQKVFKSISDRNRDGIEFISRSEFDRFTRFYTSRINGFVKANKMLVKHFKERKRTALLKNVERRYKVLKSEYEGFDDILFILPDDTLFLSLKNKESYGSDLSSYPTIKALKNSKSLSGYTIQESKLYFVAAKKIFSDGKFVGTLMFKVGTQVINEYTKNVLGAKYALAIVDDAMTSGDNLRGLKDIKIIDGSCQNLRRIPNNFQIDKEMQRLMVNEKTLLIYNKKIVDFSGQHIGYHLTVNDISDFADRYKSFFVYVIIITAIVIVISGMSIYYGFGKILVKIEMLNLELENRVKIRTQELEKANEEAKKQNEVINSLYKRFKSMFDEHHSIMLLLDPYTAEIVNANKAAVKFFGININQKYTVGDFSFMSSEQIRQKLQMALQEGFKNYETKLSSKNSDSSRNIMVQGTPIYVDNKKLIFAVCHDITEQKRMEEELLELNKSLENRVAEGIERYKEQEVILNQQSKMSAMGEMFGSIIHQWRQPLTALSFMMQDMEDVVNSGNDIDKSYLIKTYTEALEQIDYMNTTVEDFRGLLTPSKSESCFNVSESVIKVFKLVIRQIKNEKSEINIFLKSESGDVAEINLDNFTKGIPSKFDNMFQVCGLENELKQTLLNLVNNSRDAIAEARKNDSQFIGKINTKIDCSPENIVIEISDNAGGIPEDIIDKIFLPYFTTKQDSGTGIGLYMSKNIIEKQMNGNIAVENQGEGALFRITLVKGIS